jgi:DNA repair protein RadC
MVNEKESIKISELDIKLRQLELITDLSAIAYDKYHRQEHFTLEDMSNYFNALRDAFGSKEASGFLNLCLDTHKNRLNKKQQFPDSVLEAIATHMEAMDKSLSSIAVNRKEEDK